MNTHKVDPSVRFNYQSIGSGGGQKQSWHRQSISAHRMDDERRESEQSPGKLLHIPTVAGRMWSPTICPETQREA